MTKLPEHFWITDQGELCDTRTPKYPEGIMTVIRENYRCHHLNIKTVADFKATLRAGPCAWPGGYPLYFLCDDGAALSFQAAKDEARLIISAIADKRSDGWRVVACDINYEDPDETLICEHTGELIESAYDER